MKMSMIIKRRGKRRRKMRWTKRKLIEKEEVEEEGKG